MTLPDHDAYRVDLSRLQDVIGDLATCERALELLTNDVEARVARLQESWEGEAADAQREAHQEWEAGLREMRAALAEMRKAAKTAHGNYGTAVSTNVGFWRGAL
jgi:WXG100 family type VII secretion target